MFSILFDTSVLNIILKMIFFLFVGISVRVMNMILNIQEKLLNPIYLGLFVEFLNSLFLILINMDHKHP